MGIFDGMFEVYSTFHQIRASRLDSFPVVPYTHSDATAKPCICGAKETLPTGEFVVFHPSSDEHLQLVLAFLIAHSVVAVGQLL